MLGFISKWWNEIDRVTFLIIIAIATIGVVLSFSINKDFYFLNKHFLYAISAIALMIAVSSMDNKSLRRLSLIGFIIFIILLITILSIRHFDHRTARGS